MKKKTVKKVYPKRIISRRKKNGPYIEFFGIGIGMLIGVLTIVGYSSADKPYVLGTSVFLAHDGVSGGSDNSGSGSSGDGTEDHQGPPPPSENSGRGKGSMASDTLVDCVNPAGKHVRESYRACAALNKASNQSSFSFTVLKPGKDQKMPPPAHVEPSGTVKPEHELEDENEGERGSESGHIKNTHILRHDNTIVRSDFPLSIDPTTNKFSVTLPSGTKELSVMPDKAVARILQNKLLTSVENQASSSAEGGDDAASHTTLTELNNKPVFEVKGFANKKVFGLFPASFAKTVYVSADDGSVVKTDQTFFSKALEALSF
jgi:hypothetical protein